MEDHADTNHLLDVTDCLEAVGVFRAWKNFLFTVLFLFLIFSQVVFWFVNTGHVRTDWAAGQIVSDTEVAGQNTQPDSLDRPAVSSPEENKAAVSGPKSARFSFKLTVAHVTWLVRLINFVLIPASILYCLTMLFSLKVSMLGRLGGINHIARAFFLSLLVFVLLMPWQVFFAGVFSGAMYTADGLLDAYDEIKGADIIGITLYYLRYTGYWMAVLMLLASSQFRSLRWTRSMLRRLEIV